MPSEFDMLGKLIALNMKHVRISLMKTAKYFLLNLL